VLKAAVIGGSLGGLMAALALRGAGCDVDVFERVPHRLQAQGAGLRIVPEMAALLQQRAGIDLGLVSTLTRWFRHIGPANRVISDRSFPGQFTTWGALHRALSAAFGDAHYHLGRNCVDLATDRDGVHVRFADGAAETFDLAVFADGIQSTGRRLLAPVALPTYAGYVTWRGFVPASALSPEALGIFSESTTYAVTDFSHMIVYPIPDPDGVADAPSFNFVWYRNVAEGPDLDALMTDSAGMRRALSVPAGAVAGQHLEELRALADAILPPAHAEVVVKTRAPFLQALYDVETPRMACGRACLIGDAAFATRPHAGAATTKAAVDAWSLADALVQHGDVGRALAAWEPDQLRIGAAFVARNRDMGERSLKHNTFNPADQTSLPGLYEPGR
jgi:2,6-dihydroxypyridine 3-monooxygenase